MAIINRGARVGLAPDGAALKGTSAQTDVQVQPLEAKRPTRSVRSGSRRRKLVAGWHAALAKFEAGTRGRVLASADGSLAFVVQAARSGLLIERMHCPSDGPRTAQAMVFYSVAEFDRWCSVDPARFDDPILFARLCREGHEALDPQR